MSMIFDSTVTSQLYRYKKHFATFDYFVKMKLVSAVGLNVTK